MAHHLEELTYGAMFFDVLFLEKVKYSSFRRHQVELSFNGRNLIEYGSVGRYELYRNKKYGGEYYFLFKPVVFL